MTDHHHHTQIVCKTKKRRGVVRVSAPSDSVLVVIFTFMAASPEKLVTWKSDFIDAPSLIHSLPQQFSYSQLPAVISSPPPLVLIRRGNIFS